MTRPRHGPAAGGGCSQHARHEPFGDGAQLPAAHARQRLAPHLRQTALAALTVRSRRGGRGGRLLRAGLGAAASDQRDFLRRSAGRVERLHRGALRADALCLRIGGADRPHDHRMPESHYSFIAGRDDLALSQHNPRRGATLRSGRSPAEQWPITVATVTRLKAAVTAVHYFEVDGKRLASKSDHDVRRTKETSPANGGTIRPSRQCAAYSPLDKQLGERHYGKDCPFPVHCLLAIWGGGVNSCSN